MYDPWQVLVAPYMQDDLSYALTNMSSAVDALLLYGEIVQEAWSEACECSQ